MDALPARRPKSHRDGMNPRWRKLIGKSRYLLIVGIVGLLIGTLEACLASAINAYHVLESFFRHEPYVSGVVSIMHMLDAFLVAAVLLIVAIGTYGLFIEPVENVPPALKVKSFHELKVRFASVLILFMAVTFTEHLLAWEEPMNTLIFGGAIVVVVLALVAYSRWAESDHGDS
jgi:uncharacterized membrane protein YqhA